MTATATEMPPCPQGTTLITLNSTYSGAPRGLDLGEGNESVLIAIPDGETVPNADELTLFHGPMVRCWKDLTKLPAGSQVWYQGKWTDCQQFANGEPPATTQRLRFQPAKYATVADVNELLQSVPKGLLLKPYFTGGGYPQRRVRCGVCVVTGTIDAAQRRAFDALDEETDPDGIDAQFVLDYLCELGLMDRGVWVIGDTEIDV